MGFLWWLFFTLETSHVLWHDVLYLERYVPLQVYVMRPYTTGRLLVCVRKLWKHTKGLLDMLIWKSLARPDCIRYRWEIRLHRVYSFFAWSLPCVSTSGYLKAIDPCNSAIYIHWLKCSDFTLSPLFLHGWKSGLRGNVFVLKNFTCLPLISVRSSCNRTWTRLHVLFSSFNSFFYTLLHQVLIYLTLVTCTGDSAHWSVYCVMFPSVGGTRLR